MHFAANLPSAASWDTVMSSTDSHEYNKPKMGQYSMWARLVELHVDFQIVDAVWIEIIGVHLR